MVGEWNVEVTVGSLPEKVATAVGKMNEMFVGAEYTPIAYLGSQIVNGTNYAVLAEQLLMDGRDTKNVVLLIFNEKPQSIDLTLVDIERVVEGGEEFGGVKVDVETEINKTAQLVFDKAMAGFVGSDVEPFALLGTQIVRGTDFLFAAVVKPVTDQVDAPKAVCVVTVNDMDNGISFKSIL